MRHTLCLLEKEQGITRSDEGKVTSKMDRMDWNMDVSALLKKHGLKNTRQRSAILKILSKQKTPIAADELYIELQKVDVSINLSTVYRTLDAMCEKGLVRQASVSSDSRTVFELTRAEHCHYLICVNCKKIIPLSNCPLKEYESAIASETNYEITGHRLDIYGHCPACQALMRDK